MSRASDILNALPMAAQMANTGMLHCGETSAVCRPNMSRSSYTTQMHHRHQTVTGPKHQSLDSSLDTMKMTVSTWKRCSCWHLSQNCICSLPV